MSWSKPQQQRQGSSNQGRHAQKGARNVKRHLRQTGWMCTTVCIYIYVCMITFYMSARGWRKRERMSENPKQSFGSLWERSDCIKNTRAGTLWKHTNTELEADWEVIQTIQILSTLIIFSVLHLTATDSRQIRTGLKMPPNADLSGHAPVTLVTSVWIKAERKFWNQVILCYVVTCECIWKTWNQSLTLVPLGQSAISWQFLAVPGSALPHKFETSSASALSLKGPPSQDTSARVSTCTTGIMIFGKENGLQKSPNSKVKTFDTWNTQGMPEAIDNFIEIERNGAEQKTSTEKVKNRTKSLRCLVSCRCPGALAPLYRPAKQRLKMFLWTRHQSQCREHSPSLSISFHLLPLYTSRHCVCRIEKDVH